MVSRWYQIPIVGKAGLVLFICASAMLGAAGTAVGEDLSRGVDPIAPASQWRLSFTPYGWLPFLVGNTTVRGRTVAIDVDPIQVVEHLERAPWMSYAEARNGPLAFYNDIFYANLGLTADGVRSRGVHPQIGGTLSAALGLDFEEAVVEVGAAYEVARWSSGAGSTAIDILGGARYWHQEMSINLVLNANLDIGDLVLSKGIAVARGGSVDWVDPLVGGRIRHQLAPGQVLMLRGDIGGFGAGSEFSWNVLAAYSFEICAQDGVTYSGLLGYRALDVDYEQGSGRTKYEYDVLQHGPLTGLTVAF
ncbi:MAG: hypothetical protein Q8M03_05420 [Legionella sp.]|nr:hypothetical protein [Legionella sp.]